MAPIPVMWEKYSISSDSEKGENIKAYGIKNSITNTLGLRAKDSTRVAGPQSKVKNRSRSHNDIVCIYKFMHI